MRKLIQKGGVRLGTMFLLAACSLGAGGTGLQPIAVYAEADGVTTVSESTEATVTLTPAPEATEATVTPTPASGEAEVTPTPAEPEVTVTPTPEPIKEGLAEIDGKTVYRLSNGNLLVNGSKLINGYKYVFGKDGVLTRKYKYYKPGWIQKNKKWYYQQDDGTILKKKGLQKIGNYYFYLATDYSRYSGFKKIKGAYYYFHPTNGRRYQKTGWKTISKKTYYFKKNYSLAVGSCKISGKTYYFDEKGFLQKNKTTFQYKGKYYRTDANGVMTKLSDIKAQASIATWKFINQHSSPSQTNAQRFRSCFNWIEAYLHYRSKPFNAADFAGNDWPYRYVLSVLNNGVTGNCYGFACTVASIAKELGYEPYVIITTGDHGFVMIDGKYYDNMGAMFGATSHKPYGIYKKVKF